jgi:SAM-dependent methyltransferase
MLRDGRHQTGALLRAEQPWADARMAALYDAFVFEGDLPLYLDLAHDQGHRVLEVACGSGRIVIPLVRAGFDVVGIDSSSHMLALAHEKLAAEPNAPGRAELIQADMRDFDLPDQDFDLAIMAVKSFAYLIEREDQLSCLRKISSHLRPGGLLAIDFLHPSPAWVGAAQDSLRDDLLQRVPDRGYTLSRVESVVSTDLARQVRVIRSAYEVIDDHGAVLEKRFVEWSYRWTHRFEAEHLLERAGLDVEAIHGGYQREPFTSSSAVMLYLARAS